MRHILCVFLLVSFISRGQDPSRFNEEVKAIADRYDSLYNPEQQTLLFTGSSSVRMWKSLNANYPDLQIINTGFGGSQASDLLHFLDPLVFKYKPTKIFIYEGDNDIAEGKSPGVIKKDLLEIISKIQLRMPQTEIVYIAAKPSLIRWKLRRKYKRLNRKIRRFSKRNSNLYFADVWNPMLKGKNLNKEIFIEDGLHMNEDGYRIWLSVLKPYINLN